MDEEDDDNEVEDGEADDAFTFERSEKKAILTSSIRKYIVPKINFDATSFTQLIDWENPGMTEPPLTLSMTDAQITLMSLTIPAILKLLKEAFVLYQKPHPK